MIKKVVGQRINRDKQKIIDLYNSDRSIIKIAKKYGVAATTIQRRLRKWGGRSSAEKKLRA